MKHVTNQMRHFCIDSPWAWCEMVFFLGVVPTTSFALSRSKSMSTDSYDRAKYVDCYHIFPHELRICLNTPIEHGSEARFGRGWQGWGKTCLLLFCLGGALLDLIGASQSKLGPHAPNFFLNQKKIPKGPKQGGPKK